MSTYPPGTLGVLSGDLARYSTFTQSLLGLAVPEGTQILYVTGMWVASAVNRLIRAMAPESAWLMLMADDHRFAPDMLLRLLAYEVDIVAPLVCLRAAPFAPALFRETTPGRYQGLRWEDLPPGPGLLPVDTMGGPGVVLQRRVLEALSDPWFVCEASEFPNEDLHFFARCRRAGFQPHVALDVVMGHTLSVTAYPQPTETGDWGVRLWAQRDLCVLPPYPVVAGQTWSEAK